MSEKNAEQIKTLYTELAKIAPSQDWERILKVAKKILGLSVNEKKAFHCKTVCLIHLEKFDEALVGIEKNPDASDLYFEKAYCEYRLNKIQESYNTLLNCKEMTNKEKELLAQVTYRLEKYQESYDAYRDLVKNIEDEYDAERQTNFSAVVSSLRAANPESTKDLDMSENENRTYELCYNSACISISKGNFEEAQQKLIKAEKICKETFEDEEDQEFVENEMAIIRVQLAYCLQKLGKTEDALRIYNNVMKSKPSDLTVNAVASNNLVCLNKDQNVFDSKKRLRAATSSDLEPKLTSMQRKLISYNEILFSILTNQKDLVQKLLEQYKSKFDEKERYSLLKVAQLNKERKYSECEKILNELVKTGQCSSIVKFYLIQIYLAQGKHSEAIELFKSLDEYKSFKLGLISALVTLYKSKNDKQSVSDTFSNAINYFTKSNPNARELEVYIRENSNYQIESGNLQKACEMLEKIRQLRPKDFRILSKLINLYSKFDSEKAKKLSKDLPSLQDVFADSNIDIETLENQFSLLNSKYGKSKTLGTSSSLKSPDQSKSATKNEHVHKKKKKNRKVKLPKNYDPNIPLDAERWLPLRERSYYKGKRNKKNLIGKGTQGSVSTKEGSQVQPQSPKAGSTTPDMSSTQAKPRAAVVAQKKNKKKKAGSKW